MSKDSGLHKENANGEGGPLQKRAFPSKPGSTRDRATTAGSQLPRMNLTDAASCFHTSVTFIFIHSLLRFTHISVLHPAPIRMTSVQ